LSQGIATLVHRRDGIGFGKDRERLPRQAAPELGSQVNNPRSEGVEHVLRLDGKRADGGIA